MLGPKPCKDTVFERVWEKGFRIILKFAYHPCSERESGQFMCLESRQKEKVLIAANNCTYDHIY